MKYCKFKHQNMQPNHTVSAKVHWLILMRTHHAKHQRGLNKISNKTNSKPSNNVNTQGVARNTNRADDKREWNIVPLNSKNVYPNRRILNVRWANANM